MGFIKKILMILGMLTLLSMVCITGFSLYSHYSKQIQSHSALKLDFRQGLLHKPHHESVFDFIQPSPITLEECVNGIYRAKDDPNIETIILRLDLVTLSLHDVEEIRDALKAFQKTGKTVYGFADSFGEFSNGTLGYYLAALCDQLWIQPVGELNITGFHGELPFFANLLNTLEIQAQFDRRKEYKTFSEMFTKDQMTPANQESSLQLFKSLFATISHEIALDREISIEELRAHFDQAPFMTAEHAMKLGLIDQVGYIDEFKKAIKTQHPELKKTISIQEYNAAHTDEDPKDKPHIALIHGVGSIQRGEHGENLLLSEKIMGSHDTRHAIEQALSNQHVKAIILRLDCSGGSAIGSETVRHCIELSRSKGIPVVASFGSVAASGAYWMACSANQIVANKTSITGSIGVTGGKFNFKKFFEMLGVNWGAVSLGENASIWSMLTPYTEQNQAHLQDWLDRLYDRFIILVSKERKLPIEHVEEVAKGRVWTGVDAKKFGLVDHLGGLKKAISVASELVNSPANLPTIHYPKRRSSLETLVVDSGNNAITSMFSAFISAFITSLKGALSTFVTHYNSPLNSSAIKDIS